MVSSYSCWKFGWYFFIAYFMGEISKFCTQTSHRVKADFHSEQYVARTTFSERFPLECVQTTTANEIRPAWLFIVKRKRPLKVDRATFYSEWKSAFSNLHWCAEKLKIWFKLCFDKTRVEKFNDFSTQNGGFKAWLYSVKNVFPLTWPPYRCLINLISQSSISNRVSELNIVFEKTLL